MQGTHACGSGDRRGRGRGEVGRDERGVKDRRLGLLAVEVLVEAGPRDTEIAEAICRDNAVVQNAVYRVG